MKEDNRIIIGIGDGAKQSHYTRKPFWIVKISKPTKVNKHSNKCNTCSCNIPKGRRYCDACKKENRIKSQRKWRSKNA